MDSFIASESETWNRFIEGDDEALETIYSQYGKRIYQYGLSFTPNKELIEDVIQDLFSELISKRRNLGTTNNIYVYLLVSFRRKLLRYVQNEKKLSLFKSNRLIEFNIVYSIEQEIVKRETANLQLLALEKALKQLTPRQKEAIFLRFTEELEYQEISRILEMSIEACRNLISRAIKTLRKSMEKQI